MTCKMCIKTKRNLQDLFDMLHVEENVELKEEGVDSMRRQ